MSTNDGFQSNPRAAKKVSSVASETHSQKLQSVSSHPHDDLVHERAELGAARVEAAAKVWGKYSIVMLYMSLALAAYVYSLDSQTTWYYLQFGTSSFSRHGLLSSISVAQQVIVAVGKPVVARLADLQSRPFAYIIVLTCYVIGYVVIASAKNIETVAGGSVIYSMGYTGLQLLTQVVLADITALRWRGLASSLMSAPFIVNAFVGSKVYSSVVARDQTNGWRWGYGMFAIIVPIALLPLIIILLWAQHRATQQNLVPQTKEVTLVEGKKIGWGKKAWNYFLDMDAPGLVVLGAGLGLLLIPLTLASRAKAGWSNPSIIAMIVLGPCFIIAFAAYEIFLSPRPIIPSIFMRNKAVVGASLIGFFDFISFYLTFLYTSSFIYVMKTPQWSLENQGYFGNTQSVGLTVFGILAGAVMVSYRRYKLILVVGLAIRLFGVGLMIHSRGAQAPDSELVMTQIIQSIGGGFAAVTSQVGAQASVVHKHVAMVTAVILLITEIGGAVGSAVAGAIWNNVMPQKLAHYLPNVSQEDRNTLFGATTSITALAPDDPVRLGVVQAYADTMKILIIVATVMSVPPLLISLFMPNYYLGDAQNAIDGLDITGEKVEEPKDNAEKPKPAV